MTFLTRTFGQPLTDHFGFVDAFRFGYRVQRFVGLDENLGSHVAELDGHELRRAMRAALAQVRQGEVWSQILDADRATADALDLGADLQRQLAVDADAPAQVANRRSAVPGELRGLAEGHGVKKPSELFHAADNVPAGHDSSITGGHLPSEEHPYNQAMNTTQTRQRALRALIERRFGGVQARFGIAIGRQADYVSRLLSGKKALGERLAREIEATLGLERGELDREPEELGESTIPAPRFAGRLVPIIPFSKMVRLDHGKKEEEQVGSMYPALAQEASDFAPRPAGISETCVAHIVTGPAMEPEFRDGWIIYVDSEFAARHGDYVVVWPAGRDTPVLRQLVDEGGARYLRCLNPGYPEPMVALGDGKIAGRVVYQGKAY
jgi:hypothetical protein